MFNDFNVAIDLDNYKDQYNNERQLHNVNEPSRVEVLRSYYSIQFYINGVVHRCKKPALIELANNKNYISRVWVKNNLWHRFNGPAYIAYDRNSNGRIMSKYYRHYGNTVNV